MKTRTLTLLSVSLLATLMIGAFVLNAYSGPPRLRAKAYWKPNTYDTTNLPPDTWNVWLHFASSSVDASQLDASSILLEGLYSPISAPYDLPNKQGSWIVVPFNGYDVLAAAITKAGHMTVGESYLVFLEVTGQTIDGTPFNTGSSGAIVIFDPEVSPP
jgi:hypothetical protein